MKLAVFALLLVVLPFQAEASPYVCDTLIVEVMRAVGLNGDGIFSAPDGYIKAVVDGHIKQTHVIHDNANPVWNKDLKFTKVKSDKLRVELWEYDDFLHGADDHLNTCEEKLRLGSYGLKCGGHSGKLWYGVHCLKADMKKQDLSYHSKF